MDNKKILLDKIAIITGASQGIGKSIALHFLKKSYKVVAADINLELRDKWWENKLYENNLLFVKTDVSSEDSVKNLFKLTIETFGNSIKVIVNNAAISNPHQFNKSIEELSLLEWNNYMAVNLTSIFLTTKYAVPHMKNLGGSSIINISSTRSIMSEPNCEAYASTKGGVNSLTHALAISLGKYKIRVNCVLPGWINSIESELKESDHEQHPICRVGNSQDISEIVDFLADDEKSGFITGQNFIVDGGMTVKMIYD